jgi:hypothetical protein
MNSVVLLALASCFVIHVEGNPYSARNCNCVACKLTAVNEFQKSEKLQQSGLRPSYVTGKEYGSISHNIW